MFSKVRLTYKIFFILGLILDDREVDQGRCIDLIGEDILANHSTVKYPSSLGRELVSKTKQQLVLYLVSKITIELIN